MQISTSSSMAPCGGFATQRHKVHPQYSEQCLKRFYLRYSYSGVLNWNEETNKKKQINKDHLFRPVTFWKQQRESKQWVDWTLAHMGSFYVEGFIIVILFQCDIWDQLNFLSLLWFYFTLDWILNQTHTTLHVCLPFTNTHTLDIYCFGQYPSFFRTLSYNVTPSSLGIVSLQ